MAVKEDVPRRIGGWLTRKVYRSTQELTCEDKMSGEIRLAAHKPELPNPSYYFFITTRTIRFFQESGDNLTCSFPQIRQQPIGSGMSLGTFEKLEEHFKRRLRLVEELQRKPDLPMAMHEAGQAFAYEYHDIRVERCVLESRIIDGEPVQCGGITEPVNRIEITKDSLWLEVVCIMAGAAAQHGIDEFGAMDSAVRDMQHAAEFTKRVGLNLEQTDELILAASKAAAKIMTENIATVRKIADVLEQKKRIEGYEIRRIIRHRNEAARS